MAEVQVAAKLDTLRHVAIAVANVQDTVEWYTQHFDCRVAYEDETWAIVQFANVSLAFVVPEQHPPHIAMLGDLQHTARRNNTEMARGQSTLGILPAITWRFLRSNRISRLLHGAQHPLSPSPWLGGNIA